MNISKKDLLLLIIDLLSNTKGIAESRVRLMKTVFILQKELGAKISMRTGVKKLYDFDWYLFGPFSKEVLDDLDELREEGLIDVIYEDRESYVQYNYRVTDKGKDHLQKILTQLDNELYEEIKKKVDWIKKMSVTDIKRYVYQKYLDERKNITEYKEKNLVSI